MAVVPLADGRAVAIGARALAEGMAASTQRMWEDNPRLDAILAALEPEFSGWYTATRSVLRVLVGSDDLDFVNAFVCDAAKITRNPPASFIAAVAAIVGAGATTRDAVVSVVREAIPEIVQDEITYTLEDIADTIRRLPGDEPFALGVRRLLTSSLELLARRIEEPGFPIDVLCGERPADLEPLLQRYPLPVYFRGSTLLSWHDDEALGLLGEELLMMEHAMSALLFGPRYGSECPLTTSSSCKVPRTILCNTAPCRIDDAACASSSVMATFGAVGKV